MPKENELSNYPFFDTTVKQKVISFLKEHGGEEFSIKDLNKRLDIATSSLSVTLNDLERQKIVTSRKEKKYKYFSLDDRYASMFQDIFEGLENVYEAALKNELRHDNKTQK